jgi:hypothetical protein
LFSGKQNKGAYGYVTDNSVYVVVLRTDGTVGVTSYYAAAGTVNQEKTLTGNFQEISQVKFLDGHLVALDTSGSLLVNRLTGVSKEVVTHNTQVIFDSQLFLMFIDLAW